MTITRYRKRPVEVDTVQWTGTNEAEIIAFTGNRFEALAPEDRADDLEMTAQVLDVLHSTWVGVKTGQHIVRGVKGEYYPIAEDVLAETYEPAPSAPPAPSPAEPHGRVRTHITAMIEVLKEEPPEQLAQPAGLFISGMLTGLAASVQVLDGGTAEQAMEAVPARLEASIGRAYLNGTLPGTPPKTDPAAELRQVTAERDGAYRERAYLVALLAAMTDGAVIAPAVDVEEPGWQIVYLTIGGRQASWHISPRDADLFQCVPHVDTDHPRAQWDGHTTEDKYADIRQHTRDLFHQCGPACAEGHTYTGRCEGAHQADDSDTTASDVVHPATEPQASSPHGVDE